MVRGQFPGPPGSHKRRAGKAGDPTRSARFAGRRHLRSLQREPEPERQRARWANADRVASRPPASNFSLNLAARVPLRAAWPHPALPALAGVEAAPGAAPARLPPASSRRLSHGQCPRRGHCPRRSE